MRYHSGIFFAVFVAVIYMSAGVHSVIAETLPSGAFIVSPVKEELSLLPGEEKTVTVTLSNGTPYPLTVSASYEDIASQAQLLPQDNPVKLVGLSGKADSLKGSIDFPQKSFDLLSGKMIQIPIKVRLSKTTPPGGLYGSIIWSFKVATNRGEAAPANVALESRIASLFFVRVLGEVKEEGKIASFGLFNEEKVIAQPSSSTPLQLQVAFENTGNVHLNPYGRITISGMLTEPRVLIVDPWVVLPGAVRTREVNLLQHLNPGFYHAQIELNRGYNNIVDERDVTFWVLPSTLQWLIGLMLFILLTLLIRRSLAISRHSVT